MQPDLRSGLRTVQERDPDPAPVANRPRPSRFRRPDAGRLMVPLDPDLGPVREQEIRPVWEEAPETHRPADIEDRSGAGLQTGATRIDLPSQETFHEESGRRSEDQGYQENPEPKASRGWLDGGVRTGIGSNQSAQAATG